MPAPDKRQKIPPQVWLIGIAGLFGYHFFYFTALRNAPAVEASLIAYLWPLLIVLGSALMPGERLRWYHVAGALLGLAGTFLIITDGGRMAFESRYAFGYAMAGVCALLWSGYSLLSRRFHSVPTSTVTWFCAATAALSLACHLALEQTVLPSGAGEWLAVVGLGLMPVGAAFYAWDHGVKQGNIQVLGAASYAAPLLSTLILIAAAHFVLADLMRLKSGTAGAIAAIISATAFALYHDVVPASGGVDWRLFFFYTLAGLYFASVFVLRGFGIVVGVHALYDVLVLVVEPFLRHGRIAHSGWLSDGLVQVLFGPG